MKNQKTLIAIVLVLVLLIGGAYILYDRLGQNITAQQMIVHSQPQSETDSSPSPSPSPETSAADNNHSADEPQAILAPDFQVYDRDGNAVTLRSFFGKPIVLNFWASWCGPCQREMPDFNEKYAELGSDINFVMVNMADGRRETVETASSFVEKNGYSFPVFYDTTSEAAAIYGAYSLPTSFFINAEGRVIAQTVGAINAETLQRCIDMITG